MSQELVELLRYIENTTQEVADSCTSARIHRMQKRICSIKSKEEVSVKYMQRWEELEESKEEGRAEGIAEGKAEGKAEGEQQMAALCQRLVEGNRFEDLKRCAADAEYRKALMKEYGLIEDALVG